MPALGADMEFGTVLEWLLKPGDTVKRGDIIAVVDTEKATIEVEVFQSGILQTILVPVGQKVPVGTPLALITAAGEKVVAPRAARPAPPPPPSPPAPPAAAPPPPPRPRLAPAPPPPASASLRSRFAWRWT